MDLIWFICKLCNKNISTDCTSDLKGEECSVPCSALGIHLVLYLLIPGNIGGCFLRGCRWLMWIILLKRADADRSYRRNSFSHLLFRTVEVRWMRGQWGMINKLKGSSAPLVWARQHASFSEQHPLGRKLNYWFRGNEMAGVQLCLSFVLCMGKKKVNHVFVRFFFFCFIFLWFVGVHFSDAI